MENNNHNIDQSSEEFKSTKKAFKSFLAMLYPDETLKFWTDFFLKIVTGVVLVWISNNISQSIQMAEMVQKFVTDLTTENAEVRRDITLTALDGTIGDKYPEMLAGIAQILLENELEKSTSQGNANPKTIIAYQILIKRLSNDIDELKVIIKYLSAKYPKLVSEIVYNCTKDELKVELEKAIKETLTEKENSSTKTQATKEIVYIQFLKDKDGRNKKLAEKLQEYLNQQQNYSAPEPEQIEPGNKYFPTPNKIEIRYFNIQNTDSEESAKKLKDELIEFCKASNTCSDAGDSFILTPSKLNAPKGQLEIWFNIEN